MLLFKNTRICRKLSTRKEWFLLEVIKNLDIDLKIMLDNQNNYVRR